MFTRSALGSCRQSFKAHRVTRSFATVAETSSSTPNPPPTSQSTSQNDSKKAVINAAVILNRNPIITRTSTAFERTYYAYQSRIQRALHNPFPYDFYFKQGSLLEGKFMKEEEEREREAFGRPTVAGSEGESAVGAAEGGEGQPVTAKVVQRNPLDDDEEPMPRIHEADQKGDTRSLDRAGERNIYLLVKAKDASGKEVWRFPQGGVEAGELLHEAARRDLNAECGEGMDTWIVSRNPIGVYRPQSTPSAADTQAYLFFYKAHILAGQVRPDDKKVSDFAWLTKQEIEPRVGEAYWAGVKDMLSDF